MVGMVVSFVPQIYNICRARSSRGISLLFALCSALMGCSSVAGAAVLQRSKFWCCDEWGSAACPKELVPLASLAVQAVCTTAVFFLVVLFLPTAMTTTAEGADLNNSEEVPRQARAAAGSWDDRNRTATTRQNGSRAGSWALAVFVVCAAVMVGLPVYFAHTDSGHAVDTLGRVLGASSTAFTLVQYFPQLATTWRLRGLGNFSIKTLIIQSVGGIGFGMYLLVGGRQNLVTWLPPLVTGSFQICLLILNGIFKREQRKSGHTDLGATSPLLPPKDAINHSRGGAR
jgi:uncharacterized protein with PQ loop repeat